jgi:LuxR family maltose regulon positive regulatory protein
MNFNKIRPPEIPLLHYERLSCQKRLDEILAQGHAFIQSPSGYGKSTLAVSFLKQKKIAFTWLSLDQSDNNLPQVINYLCLALEQVELKFDQTQSLLNASHIVGDEDLADSFLEEFRKIKSSIFMVLDDLHVISDQGVSDFLFGLIKSATASVRLLLLSRAPLPSKQWKSLSSIGFLGRDELKFSLEEYQDYNKRLLGIDSKAKDYHEGWITAIRLSTESKLNQAQANSIEQLVNNSINQFSKPEHIYFLANIEYFDANLCNQILGNAHLLTELERSPLILVKIKEDQGVYRFHHFIQELILKTSGGYKNKDLGKLYQKAIDYFLDQGDYQQAYEIALKFGDQKRLNSVFNTYRLHCFNNSRLQELSTAFTKLQQAGVKKTEEHRLTEAWIEIFKGNTLGMIELIQAQDLNDMPENLCSEYLALKAYTLYVLNQPEESLKAVREARNYTLRNRYAEGYLHIFQIGSLQSIGRGDEGYSLGIEALSTTTNTLVKSNILLILCYISRLEARAQQQYDFSRALYKISEDEGNQEGLVQASCFLGEYFFNKGELKTAERYLKMAYLNRKQTIGIVGMSIVWLYLKTLHLIGKSIIADEILHDVLDETMLSGNAFLLEFYHGMRAHMQLNLNQGSRAYRWLENVNLSVELPLSEAYSPMLSAIYLGLRSKHQIFNSLVKKLEPFLKEANNKRYLGELEILQTVALSKKNKTKAQVKLSQAVKRLPIDEFKQIYTDYSASFPSLVGLMQEINEFNSQSIPSKRVLITNREQQVIDLYSERLTDKEMAKKLGISLATVKRHNVNIFNKLQVSSKRQVQAILRNT